MTDRALRPVCLIGPPAAGKTTLAEALGLALNAPIIRPRDLVHRAVGQHPSIIGLFSRDARGRVPDESLGLALRLCLDSLDGLVILESLPWDVIQLVLYLHATDDLVLRRKAGRKYCPACYPTPALPDGDATACGRCGGALTLRADDDLLAFQERLQLHRANAAGILSLALKLKIAVVTIEATESTDGLVRRILKNVKPPLNDQRLDQLITGNDQTTQNRRYWADPPE